MSIIIKSFPIFFFLFLTAAVIASPSISSSSSSQSKSFLSAIPSSIPPPALVPPSSIQYPEDVNIKKKGEADNKAATVPIRNVMGLLGRHARLPCDITPPSSDNPLLLVIWFKEPSPDPVYR